MECLFKIVEETIRRLRIALRDENADLNEVEPYFRAFRDNTAPHFDLAALILLRTRTPAGFVRPALYAPQRRFPGCGLGVGSVVVTLLNIDI